MELFQTAAAVLIGIDIAMIAFGRQRLAEFRQCVPQIRNRSEMEYFARVAAIQTQVMLLHLCANIAISGLFFLGWRLAYFPRTIVVTWFLTMTLTNAFAYYGHRTAVRVRATPSPNPVLSEKHKVILDTWSTRRFLQRHLVRAATNKF